MSVYSDTLVLNEFWANYINDTQNYKYNFCEGAVRSSKSVSNTLAFALHLEKTPDKLHLVIASTVASARNIVEDGDGKLGLKYYFAENYKQTTYKNNDAGIIKTATGEKIVVYLGGLMESSYKQFRGWSVGSIVLEEANLLHENTIIEAKSRTLMAQDPKYFISMNPCASTAKIYEWLDDLQSKGIVNYNHSTIFNNPAITDERRNEIISEFDKDSLYYRQMILGQRVNAEGAVYKLYDYNKIDIDLNDYISYVCIMDIGDGPSATAFICLALRKGFKGCDVLYEYRHRNDDKQNKMNPKNQPDYVNDFADFILNCIHTIGRPPVACIIDASDSVYRLTQMALNERHIGNITLKYPYKEKIDERIKYSCSLLYQGRLRFNKSCKETIKSFEQVEYDPKAYDKGEIRYNDQPTLGTRCDEVDATLYGVYYYYNDIKRVPYDIHIIKEG